MRFWHRQRLAALIADDDKPSQELCEFVQVCLDAGGRLTSAQQRLLIHCIDQLTARLQPALWRDDQAEYFRTRDLLTVARLLEAAGTTNPVSTSGGQ
ncbi:hypothetical protein [Actinomadura sp. NEAU-AAG7]|uniref:hypothetical protein n=1 Tax=Actinomadura sp. NEAU-AAG7 TaxID=2839640 RepID=UPI002032F24F|nr:hypothetical protein [Actinomadura sp. NEAU-AAG7]